jgi:hypothetical protein
MKGDQIMANDTKITRAKGGTAERVEQLSHIQLPDLWHLALELPGEMFDADTPQGAVLEVWHLAHDLIEHIRENE